MQRVGQSLCQSERHCVPESETVDTCGARGPMGLCVNHSVSVAYITISAPVYHSHSSLAGKRVFFNSTGTLGTRAHLCVLLSGLLNFDSYSQVYLHQA